MLFIGSMNWRGRPLTSHDVIINSIAATTTRTGQTVDARLDEGSYPTGVQVTSGQMAALPVSRHPFHGDWNYTLHPVPPEYSTWGLTCRYWQRPDAVDGWLAGCCSSSSTC